MTSSASQPDLLGGWESWTTGTSSTAASMSANAKKTTFTGNQSTDQLNNHTISAAVVIVVCVCVIIYIYMYIYEMCVRVS